MCVDSQRYLGAMLPYVHHPPVADTLAQIVTVSHLASAHGGVGPQATLSSTGASGGGGMGGGGMFGGGMFGGFGSLMGGGGFGGLGADQRQAESPFAGQLTLYGQRGVSAPPAARLALWRTLSPWGFLAVLASHVHRAEYAPVRGHATAAADVLLHLVRFATADQHGDLLLGVLGNAGGGGARGGSAVLRSLARGASWPKPGADFPAALPPASPTALYCAGGDVPERQRECMRVAAELMRLAFLDQVPAPPDAAGGGLAGAGLQPPRMVENRLARAAPSFASAVVAFLPQVGQSEGGGEAAVGRGRGLPAAGGPVRGWGGSSCGPLSCTLLLLLLPQIGYALCRVNVALSGATPVVGRRGSVTGGAAGAAAAAAAGGAKKKRNKKKKGGAGAAAGGASAGGGGTASPSVGPAVTPAHGGGDDDDDEDAVPFSAKTDSPAFGGGDASRSRSASAATMPALSLDGASDSARGDTSGGAAAASDTASQQPRKAPPAPAARVPFRHPGHDYQAPFGLFRLYASQLLSLLVQVWRAMVNCVGGGSSAGAQRRLCRRPSHSRAPVPTRPSPPCSARA